LNIDLGINNERQDCKMGAVCVGSCGKGGRVNARDEGEGIGLMSFKEIEQGNLL
jgi:hypothetical protein